MLMYQDVTNQFSFDRDIICYLTHLCVSRGYREMLGPLLVAGELAGVAGARLKTPVGP